jgi:hypothetical protein
LICKYFAAVIGTICKWEKKGTAAIMASYFHQSSTLSFNFNNRDRVLFLHRTFQLWFLWFGNGGRECAKARVNYPWETQTERGWHGCMELMWHLRQIIQSEGDGRPCSLQVLLCLFWCGLRLKDKYYRRMIWMPLIGSKLLSPRFVYYLLTCSAMSNLIEQFIERN